MSTRWARNFFGRLLGLKFVRALNNYSKWRRFWTSPVQVTKNLESSRLACTGIPSTTGSPKITKRSPNVERNNPQLIDESERAHWFGYYIMAHIPWWLSQWKLFNCIIQWSSFYLIKADKPLGMLVEHSKNSNSNSSRVLPTSRVVYQLLYNNQINARAVIGQSAVGYCYYKPTEKSRVLWIII